MDKPTIFFSHSSKDKELILPIKNKLDNITSNVMDIFMSSDGQSIPFGHNWVHKIEEGLKKAQIMFVFVTPTSINSSWIYFEAGFAYSKGIEVIPVGLGVNIGQLKPPLNLLQGFDIISYESLNNFVSVINKKFNFKFEENFIDDDYKKINSILNKIPNCINIEMDKLNARGGKCFFMGSSENVLNLIKEKAKQCKKTILLPETMDDRTYYAAAQAIKKACPADRSLCTRYGGDELLALVFGECDPDEMTSAVEKLLKEFNDNSGLEYKVSASCGAYSVIMNDSFNFEDTFRFADEQMYITKRNKKNRRK